jgi:hypothetical protein
MLPQPLAKGVANPFHIAKVDPAKIIEFSFTDLMNSGGITLIFRGFGSRFLVAELKVKGLLPVHEGGRS